MSTTSKALLQVSSPFPSSINPPPTRKPPPVFLLSPRAAADEDTATDAAEPDDSVEVPADPSFEKRLSQIRLKYRSGTGKKAEQRKARKSAAGTAEGKKKGSMLLPPVPLREPVAAGGLAVEAGLTPYTERLHGRLAGLGLAALLLVELGSGQSLLRYHTPAVIFIQIYTVAAAGSLLVKFDKEKISVWPEKSPSSSSAVAGD